MNGSGRGLCFKILAGYGTGDVEVLLDEYWMDFE